MADIYAACMDLGLTSGPTKTELKGNTKDYNHGVRIYTETKVTTRY